MLPDSVVLATNNAKKLVELKALLPEATWVWRTPAELGIPEREEPYRSFVENALFKARHASAESGLPAIADDSGLCVDALDGAPGVDSANYAGWVRALADREATRRAQDAANNARLLEALASRSAPAERSAHYTCVLVALRRADDPEPLIAQGRWRGRILTQPQGSGGFGYDPLVFIDALGSSVADLDVVRKNAESHRARAAAQLRLLLGEAGWLLR